MSWQKQLAEQCPDGDYQALLEAIEGNQMKAKIIKPTDNGRNYSNDKELVSAYSVVAMYKGELVEAVTARTWMGRSRNASVVYASIWARPVPGSGRGWCSGRGSAGGYGYHKESAAFDSAISDAGIQLFGDVYGREDTDKRASIAGVGGRAMEKAFMAIARANGFRGKLLMVRH